MKKTLRSIIFTVFIGFFVISALLHSQTVKNHVKDLLKEQIEKKTGYQVEIDQLTLYPAPSLKANGITVYDQEHVLFSIDEFSVHLSLLSLWKKRVHFTFQLLKEGEEWLGDLTYEKGEGSFSLTTDKTWMLTGDYRFALNGVIEIPHFHGTWGPFTLGGHLFLAKDGNINSSSFFIGCGDLSQMSSATGKFYGEGFFSGHLLSPKVQATLRSDAIDLKGNVFERVLMNIFPHQISLSFLRENLSYHFSGDLAWDEGFFPSHLSMQTTLAELTQLFACDWIDLDGQINCDILLSKKGITGRGEFLAKDESGGKYSGNGTFACEPQKRFPYALTLHMENAPILQMDDLSGRANGHLTLTGTIDEGKLEGNLITQSVTVSLPEKTSDPLEEIEVIYINEPDAEMCSSLPKNSPPSWPLNLDITLKIPDNGKVLSRELNSKWKGEVMITGTSMTPLFNGECKLINGKYLLKGKTLTLKEGIVTFGGDFAKNSKLYVVAGYDMEKISIEAVVRGDMLHPTISFRSSPPLSQKEIFSWLLFNKGIEDISTFQGKQLNRSISDLSSDGPDLLSRIGDAVGIDRIEINGMGGEDPTKVSVRFGKYLTEGTLLSITHHLFGNSNQAGETNRVGIETDFGRHLKFQAEIGDDSNGQVNILWKKDY